MTIAVTDELALIESQTLRSQYLDRVEVLDEVAPLPEYYGTHYVTTELVAEYFDVGLETVKSVVKDHRAELASNGYTVLRGADLKRFKEETGLESTSSSLALYAPRTVLNLAMLLRDSDRAREVRSMILDLATQNSPGSDLALPQDYESALYELWQKVKANRELEQLVEEKQQVIEVMEPKAALADLHAQADNFTNLRSFARKIQQWYRNHGKIVYQATIFDWLHQIGLIIRRPGGLEHNQATAWAIRNGYALNHTVTIKTSDGLENVTAARLTPLGEQYAWDRIYNLVGDLMSKDED